MLLYIMQPRRRRNENELNERDMLFNDLNQRHLKQIIKKYKLNIEILDDTQEGRKQTIDRLITALNINPQNGEVYFKNKKAGGKTEILVYTGLNVNPNIIHHPEEYDMGNNDDFGFIEENIQQQPIQQPIREEPQQEQPQQRKKPGRKPGILINGINQANIIEQPRRNKGRHR